MEVLYKIDEVIVGSLTYSFISDRLISIDSTFVDSNYRSRGIADKLMHNLVEIMETNNYKCIPVCSYAVNWFNKNSNYQYLLNNF